MTIKDNERKECANHIRRGDELYDQNCQLHDALGLKDEMLDQKEEAIEDLADRLRERDNEVIRLTKLLIDNGINFEEE